MSKDTDNKDGLKQEKSRLKEKVSYYNPNTRDGKINIFKDYFAPLLEDTKWKNKYEPSEEHVERAREHLAKEYYDLSIPVAKSTLFLLILLAITDFFLKFNAQIYGIFLSLMVAPASIFPSLKGPDVIASVVDDSNKDAERKLAAQEMALGNVVLLILVSGFLIQLYTVEFLPRREILTNNVAETIVPEGTVGITFILIFVTSVYYFTQKKSGR